ncbi:hypothetical protein GCM10011395_25130 [Sphingomonas psychrolutea]|uniref:Protein-glutamine gamma-glutamyltransferase-like C-terminal domain-containing protein n=1 Tax=Sphingomonas psychrolutea TaxID=1259676 RepID=A0ABQ1H0F0_9SPHN|nr:hypothetical protein GCM10011395_25130 [Sphingomonas psychrolutea]
MHATGEFKVSGATAQQVATATDRFAAAHAALKADPTVQFTLRRAPPPPQPPTWLEPFLKWLERVFEPVGRFFAWIDSFFPHWPYARIFLWSVLAVVVALVAWGVYQRIRYGEWRLPRRIRLRATAVVVDEEAWSPDAAPVREWLREADAMAAAGRYAEAVHHLLFRSIEDIARRRPRLVRPALTSRELSASDALPPSARDLFAGIARLVERSLFGGRPVDAVDWTGARAAYSDFALPGTWRA